MKGVGGIHPMGTLGILGITFEWSAHQQHYTFKCVQIDPNSYMYLTCQSCIRTTRQCDCGKNLRGWVGGYHHYNKIYYVA